MTRVGVYRAAGQWCYVALEDKVYESSSSLGVVSTEPESEALAQAAQLFPGADIRRVEDIT